jgi:hypothetical protein
VLEVLVETLLVLLLQIPPEPACQKPVMAHAKIWTGHGKKKKVIKEIVIETCPGAPGTTLPRNKILVD